MATDYAPKLGAGLSLLNFFGLTTASARGLALTILSLVLGFIFIRLHYPCRSPASLMEVIDQATTLFDKCLVVRAFNEEEYGRFTKILQRVTVRASQFAARTPPESTEHNIYCEYTGWVPFLWERLKDTVECHRQVQALIWSLENMNYGLEGPIFLKVRVPKIRRLYASFMTGSALVNNVLLSACKGHFDSPGYDRSRVALTLFGDSGSLKY
ncbi:hypothetical protein L218DRAFT_950244 [Marasmius fiardii PR-910]|nr:hypothetical protein L218DRAFT_950244 [Marasmius fiardii PR-910]